MARLIDAGQINYHEHTECMGHGDFETVRTVTDKEIEEIQPVDAVEVVRCKECRFAKPYERMDGKTGYYCQFCGHSFNYGTNSERLYNPIKESDDFCSCGERKDGGHDG